MNILSVKDAMVFLSELTEKGSEYKAEFDGKKLVIIWEARIEPTRIKFTGRMANLDDPYP